MFFRYIQNISMVVKLKFKKKKKKKKKKKSPASFSMLQLLISRRHIGCRAVTRFTKAMAHPNCNLYSDFCLLQHGVTALAHSPQR